MTLVNRKQAGGTCTGHCDKSMLQIFFIFTILNTYVPLIFHAKIQLKISCGSGGAVDFVSNSRQLGYLI